MVINKMAISTTYKPIKLINKGKRVPEHHQKIYAKETTSVKAHNSRREATWAPRKTNNNNKISIKQTKTKTRTFILSRRKIKTLKKKIRVGPKRPRKEKEELSTKANHIKLESRNS